MQIYQQNYIEEPLLFFSFPVYSLSLFVVFSISKWILLSCTQSFEMGICHFPQHSFYILRDATYVRQGSGVFRPWHFSCTRHLIGIKREGRPALLQAPSQSLKSEFSTGLKCLLYPYIHSENFGKLQGLQCHFTLPLLATGLKCLLLLGTFFLGRI